MTIVKKLGATAVPVEFKATVNTFNITGANALPDLYQVVNTTNFPGLVFPGDTEDVSQVDGVFTILKAGLFSILFAYNAEIIGSSRRGTIRIGTDINRGSGFVEGLLKSSSVNDPTEEDQHTVIDYTVLEVGNQVRFKAREGNREVSFANKLDSSGTSTYEAPAIRLLFIRWGH